MPDALESDGVTVASKSLSLSFSWWRQLLSVARECCLRALFAVVEFHLNCVFEGDEPVNIFGFPFWRKDLEVDSLNCHRVASSALSCRVGDDLCFSWRGHMSAVRCCGCDEVVQHVSDTRVRVCSYLS